MNDIPNNDYSVLVRNNRFIDIKLYNHKHACIIQNLDCIIDYDIINMSEDIIIDNKYLGKLEYNNIDDLCKSLEVKENPVNITLKVNGGLAEANYLAGIIINRLEKVIMLNRIYKGVCAERKEC